MAKFHTELDILYSILVSMYAHFIPNKFANREPTIKCFAYNFQHLFSYLPFLMHTNVNRSTVFPFSGH